MRKILICCFVCALIGAFGFLIVDCYHQPPLNELDTEVSIQSADDSYGDVKISKIVRVYDGDTFTVDIDKWPRIVGSNISVRISGIDTPEKNDQRAKLRRLSLEAKAIVELTLKNATIVELRNINRDKYFRINADVFADDVNVGQMLLNKGLAKPYDGGKKSIWTSADADDYFKNVKP